MRWLLVTALLGSTAVPASAQANCLEQLKFPEVGRWAEYKARYQNDPYTIRYSVIGSEAREGKDYRWVEMQMTGSQKDKNLVYQVLVPESFSEIDQVQEVIFK